MAGTMADDGDKPVLCVLINSDKFCSDDFRPEMIPHVYGTYSASEKFQCSFIMSNEFCIVDEY